MACYDCSECVRQYIDDDVEPCTEHPTKDGELICEQCAAEYEENGNFTTLTTLNLPRI